MTIKKEQSGETTIQVRQDEYDRYKTVVTRLKNLDMNVLYWGYDKQEAIDVYDECLERFDIDEVDDLSDIQWSKPD